MPMMVRALALPLQRQVLESRARDPQDSFCRICDRIQCCRPLSVIVYSRRATTAMQNEGRAELLMLSPMELAMAT